MQHTQAWSNKLKIASKLASLANELYLDSSISLYLKGIEVTFASPTQIVKLHTDYAVDLNSSLKTLQDIHNNKLTAASIDLGYFDSSTAIASIKNSLPNATPHSRDIVLYGFGRIGRLLARLLTNSALAPHARLRAIVVRNLTLESLAQRVRLFINDSVHGEFTGEVILDTENSSLIVNGHEIKVINSSNPASIDYTAYGINNALIVDNTGKLKDLESLSTHLEAKGASQVMLTAPASGDVPNVVYGINSQDIGQQHPVVCAASCTTNAIAPILSAIDSEFGIHSGHLETVHAYTNDQNLLDNHHKSNRRGRSAAINMVITATGAAKAVAKVLPNLSGKLSGNAIRVPTANVSMAVLHLQLNQAATKESLEAYLRKLQDTPVWNHVLGLNDNVDAVSTDFIGSRYAGIVDLPATIIKENNLVLYVWYDNEHSYSAQVVRFIQQLSGGVLPIFPANN